MWCAPSIWVWSSRGSDDQACHTLGPLRRFLPSRHVLYAPSTIDLTRLADHVAGFLARKEAGNRGHLLRVRHATKRNIGRAQLHLLFFAMLGLFCGDFLIPEAQGRGERHSGGDRVTPDIRSDVRRVGKEGFNWVSYR